MTREETKKRPPQEDAMCFLLHISAYHQHQMIYYVWNVGISVLMCMCWRVRVRVRTHTHTNKHADPRYM